ncbi:hypothetical protein [Riemerella anatipestifer]|uniref:hypothetical protein n=1 Tax=Riemerella anatipestifer TaxID=34085 RepID=UPI00129E1538|nr:hypothetical protein [Riemerella anatipestifer]MRM83905.1 hypothetical protein [Riemerella anatipestifer]
MKRVQILVLVFILTFIKSQSLNGFIKDSINTKNKVFNLKLKNIETEKEYFSHTGIDGKYEFQNISNGKYILSVIYNNHYLNNEFSIDINGNTTHNFHLTKYCKFSENTDGICPICKSNQNVLPIFYGLTTTKFIKKNKNKYHFRGCEISSCDPKWYCKKDNLEF